MSDEVRSPFLKPHAIVTSPGGLEFVSLDKWPEKEALPAPTDLFASQQVLPITPDGSLDPAHCWDDVITIINARVVGDYDGVVIQNGPDNFVGHVDHTPSGFNSDPDRRMFIFGCPLLEPKKKPYIWTRQDILAARNTLRALNAEIIFQPLKRVWSVETIRDLLEPRWVRLDETVNGWITSSTESVADNYLTITYSVDLGPTLTGTTIGAADLTTTYGNVYTFDMKDGYGPRTYGTSNARAILPGELLQRWAIEDAFVGDQPKVTADTLDYRPAEPGTSGYSAVISCFHATKDGVILDSSSSISYPLGPAPETPATVRIFIGT